MRKSNTPFVIAIVSLSIVAVCAIGVAVGFGLGAFDGLGSSGKAAPAASQAAASASASASTSASAASESAASKAAEKSEAAASAGASASAGSSSADLVPDTRSSTGSSKIVQPTQHATAIDLANTTDYYDVNLFLSNFSEWPEFYRNGKSFARDNVDMRQLVNWAMWHNALNNESTLDTNAADLPGAPESEASKGIDGIAPTTYLRSMSTELIEQTIESYTGLDVDLAGYNSGDGAYYERDGKMYEGLYRGSADMHDNVALANSVKSMGDNVVRVDFTIYFGNSSTKAVSDKSWYGLNGQKLEAAMRAAGATNVTTKPATAFIEVVPTNDGRTFRLVSFELNDVEHKAL